MKTDYRVLTSSLYEISKPGITYFIVFTTAVGYFLSLGTIDSYSKFFITLLCTAGSSAGSAALNNYIEREYDLRMERTKSRPIPSGRLAPSTALLYGIILSIVSTSVLAWSVNLLAGFLALMTVFLYTLVYTPLKRTTWLNTFVGAIPGALPIAGGWAAATGTLSLNAWILFGIMFLWQHPHFFSLAWLYKEDYEKGGFQMLPVLDKKGTKTFYQILSYTLALCAASLLPYISGIANFAYIFGAFVLGFFFIKLALQGFKDHSNLLARKIFLYSLLYIPSLLGILVVDTIFFPR